MTLVSTGPAVDRAATRAPTQVLALSPRSRGGFYHIYGWLGVPIFLVFLVSSVWSIALVAIQLAPTFVANTLMGTGAFDFGEFWLLPSPELRIAIPASLALVLFATSYVGLAVLMVFPDKMLSTATLQHGSSGSPSPRRRSSVSDMLKHPSRWSTRVSARTVPPTSIKVVSSRVDTILASSNRLRARLTYDPDSPLFALPKLVFQTTTLFTYLKEGFPTMLIFNYSSLLLVNWLLSGYRFTRTRPDPYLIVSRVCYSFDLFFAVFAPLHVLVYAYNHFIFDREVFQTRVETLGLTSFDRTARLFADPTQISLFRIAFQHLQLTTATSLLIKCLLNVFTIAKWRLVIIHLVRLSAATQADAENANSYRRRQMRWERARRLAIAAMFIGVGWGVFFYTIIVVVTSTRVCATQVQCKVPSYQWNLGATHCSCIVFVDRPPFITNWAEWENPPDITASLASLARTGHLKIIQIVNRQLPTLPEELRNCRHLEQLILIYAKIRLIPDWAKDFDHLGYLHIEGDLTTKQLLSMPRDLFVNMDHLLFLHLGCHLSLPYLPELNSLVRLEYLVLAMLHKITEIPTIDKLTKLKKLYILDNIQLVSLPHVATLHSLNTFALEARVPVCCNGFLPGGCDLTAWPCLDRTSTGEKRVSCSQDQYSADDYRTLFETQGPVCPPYYPFDLKDLAPTAVTIDQLCGGVLYKQCFQDNGIVGICFPERMQPIHCTGNPELPVMRRLQIQREVGDPCDPSVEKWLGCV